MFDVPKLQPLKSCLPLQTTKLPDVRCSNFETQFPSLEYLIFAVAVDFLFIFRAILNFRPHLTCSNVETWKVEDPVSWIRVRCIFSFGYFEWGRVARTNHRKLFSLSLAFNTADSLQDVSLHNSQKFLARLCNKISAEEIWLLQAFLRQFEFVKTRARFLKIKGQSFRRRVLKKN